MYTIIIIYEIKEALCTIHWIYTKVNVIFTFSLLKWKVFCSILYFHFLMCICYLYTYFFSKTNDWYYKNNWYTKKKQLTRIYNIIKFVKTLLLQLHCRKVIIIHHTTARLLKFNTGLQKGIDHNDDMNVLRTFVIFRNVIKWNKICVFCASNFV